MITPETVQDVLEQKLTGQSHNIFDGPLARYVRDLVGRLADQCLRALDLALERMR